MLKRISLIGIVSASLVACGSGSTNNARNPVNPNAAYGNVQGPLVAYTGPLSPFYTTLGLQGIINTAPSVVTALQGVDLFGVCFGMDTRETQLQQLCTLNNMPAISNNPNFSTVFAGVKSVDNFVAITATALGITSVKPYRVQYTTPGAPFQFAGGATNPQTVSAAILVPQTASGALQDIKGVVLYYHPTILSKGGVPSDFDGTLTPNNTEASAEVNSITAFVEDAMLAAIYASHGYIVVAPDYVGQGANYMVQHPYVIFPQTNAQSGLTALKAARTALASIGVDLPTPTNLYISSYSEGGAYALWASRLAQIPSSQSISGYPGYSDFLSANGFSLRRTVGVSGAYDLTGATLHYEFANANNVQSATANVWNVSPGLYQSATLNPTFNTPTILGGAKATAAISLSASKSSLAGYVLSALAYYNSSSASLNVLAPNYSPMTTCLNWSISTSTGAYVSPGTVTPQNAFINCPLNMNVAGLYNTSGLTQTQIVDQSFAAAAAASVGTNAFLTGGQTFNDLLLALSDYVTGKYANNSVGSFAEPGVLDDPTITPFVAQGNIQSWVTNSPLDLLFLNYDSTVPNINSLEACGNLPTANAFPGYQPGYTGGVKQLSPAGMVTCINMANNGVGSLPQLYTFSGEVPVIVDHGQAEAILQILALNQFLANP